MPSERNRQIDFKIFLITNEFVSARNIADLIKALETQTKIILGPDSDLGVSSLKLGSVVLELVAITASVAAVGSFLLQIVSVCKQERRPNSKLAKIISQVTHQQNVSRIVFQSEGIKIEVEKFEIPPPAPRLVSPEEEPEAVEFYPSDESQRSSTSKILGIDKKKFNELEVFNDDGRIIDENGKKFFQLDKSPSEAIEIDSEWFRNRRVDHLVGASVHAHGRAVLMDGRLILVPFEIYETN